MTDDSKDVRVKQAEEVFGRVAANPGLPRLYANGFTLGLTNADVYLVLLLSGQPVGTLNLSYTLAKTLSARLGALVTEFEKRTERNLLTTEDVDQIYGEGT